jgi:polyferredoxin
MLFMWFCIVASLGEKPWQMRGWPINWLLQLDPLVAIGTLITTRTLYKGLAWALLTVVGTVVLGRFFCGWVCPMGTLHHFAGYCGSAGKTVSQKAARNHYHPGHTVKYAVLIFLLGSCVGDLMAGAPVFSFFGASLQIGILDPLSVMFRSVNLVVLPMADSGVQTLFVNQRYTEGAWLIGAFFFTSVFMNLMVPRFYCRFICPLGALFGILGRWSLWRIGKTKGKCAGCTRCEIRCEGACQPSKTIRTSECVLCMNCVDGCSSLMGYQTSRSESGEIVSPDLGRRGVVVALFSGLIFVPVARLGGTLASNWPFTVVRPPGSLSEIDFLKRCIKCGQCMRVCPTNVIQPALLQAGIEGLWTPVLDFRSGTSGCQYNCIACGHVCPTAAIRPLSLQEKQGTHAFAKTGPIRLGTAFIDQGRCLPWSMSKPCIVCQENCPVSPKAIYTKQQYVAVRDARYQVRSVSGLDVEIQPGRLQPFVFATGEYYCRSLSIEAAHRRRIVSHTENILTLAPDEKSELFQKGQQIDIELKVNQPYVDIEKCIGCGICEHECPVSGQRAIRVSAENESRNKKHALLLS